MYSLRLKTCRQLKLLICKLSKNHAAFSTISEKLFVIKCIRFGVFLTLPLMGGGGIHRVKLSESAKKSNDGKH